MLRQVIIGFKGINCLIIRQCSLLTSLVHQETPRTYNLDVEQVLFLTADEETIIECLKFYEEDFANYKSYFNNDVKTNNKLCYYLAID